MKKIFTLLFVLFAGMTAFAQDAKVTVDDVRIKAGGTALVTVNVTNATNYRAVGMLVNLPEGFTFVYDEEEELYCGPGNVWAKTHAASDSLQHENVLKFIIASMKNAPFKYDKGSLVTFRIKCKNNMSKGVYKGTLSTIEFNKINNGGPFKPSDVTFKITVVGEGVNSIYANDATSRVGKRITLPPEGINLEDATVADRGADHEVSYKLRSGSYKVEVDSPKGRPFYDNEGAFLELVLKSDNTIDVGDYVVQISDIIMCPSEGENFTAKDFTVKLSLAAAITVDDIVKLIYEYLEP